MVALFGRGLGGREGRGRGREKEYCFCNPELRNCLQLGCFSKVLCHSLAQSWNTPSSNTRNAKGINHLKKWKTMNSGHRGVLQPPTLFLFSSQRWPDKSSLAAVLQDPTGTQQPLQLVSEPGSLKKRGLCPMNTPLQLLWGSPLCSTFWKY